jgi:hypothetical protein
MNTPHKIKWFVVVNGQRAPRVSTMRGQWAYDATCSCGWDSRTGGALLRYVRDQVWLHKTLAH